MTVSIPNTKAQVWRPFYKISHDDSGNFKGLKVDYYLLVELLKSMGFYRYDIDLNTSIVVRIEDGIVEEMNPTQVIDAVEEYIKAHLDAEGKLPDGVYFEHLAHKLYSGVNTYFREAVLLRLRPPFKIEFNEDDAQNCYFYYQNGYVRVTRHGVELLPYWQLQRHIWKEQILPRPFPERMVDFHDHPFAQFVRNISGNHDGTMPERERSLRTIIGYCLHKYFEGRMQAIVLTDSRLEDDDSGRSGKTLLCKSMGRMLNTSKESQTFVELNGKDFDPSDRFKYQELSVNTRLVHINDLKKYFQVDLLFNDVTEGIKVQKKNKQPFVIQAKMVLSTNRTVEIRGDSAKARFLEFELADYYNANFSPDKEFGMWFFRDWGPEDWAAFDLYMVECVQFYLQHGILQPRNINLEQRKLREETAPEFVDFMDDFVEPDVEYNRTEIWERFIGIESHRQQFPKLRPRTFYKWLKKYAEYSPHISDLVERKSDGNRLVTFKRGGGSAQQVDDEELVF